MKYAIESIEKGRTIKSVQIVKGKKDAHINFGEEVPVSIDLIMVNYLDGTQDVFEFNEETLNRIQNMVDAQAKTFVDKYDTDTTWSSINFAAAAIALIISISGFFTYSLSVSTPIFMGLVSAFCTVNAARLKIKENNIKKHKIYTSKIMGKLEEYNEILKKENAIAKTDNKELVNIINIDKKSVKELEQIGNKIERYNEIEGKSPKKKSL